MIEPDDEKTGLPGLRTWPRVYLVVACTLVAWIGLLALLTRALELHVEAEFEPRIDPSTSGE